MDGTTEVARKALCQTKAEPGINRSGARHLLMMARLLELLLLLAIPATIFLHQHLSPYTKVEESFNIQAAHDILEFGVPCRGNVTETFRAQYDHFTFPGAVPRTFVGALVLAGIGKPFIWLYPTIDRQALVRGILGAFNAVALMWYATAIRRAFGKATATWYIVFQVSQFHVIYYASRTLPNMFAFGNTTLAFGALLPDAAAGTLHVRASKRYRLALYLLALSGAIFRSEIAVLLGTTTLNLWFRRQIRLRQEIIPSWVTGLLIGLLITLSVDSFFWQQVPLWPELSGFLYNIVSGKASDWGTHPWHFYFTNALPRLLLNPVTYFVGIPSACFLPSRGQAMKSLLIPPLTYVTLYSLQPHKEWRFIVYTVPPLTAAAAIGASYAWAHRTKSIFYRMLSIAFILSTLATFCISNILLLPASAANYPGARALNNLHQYADGSKRTITVHMDTLACQTGVTRFLERGPPKTPLIVMPGSPDGKFPELRSGSSKWVYDKTEDEETKSSDAFWDRFDYALVENADHLGGSSGSWELVEHVRGFGGVKVLHPGDDGEGSQAEKDFVRKILGDAGVFAFEKSKDIARKYVTRGWWVEMRMVPKVKIMRRV